MLCKTGLASLAHAACNQDLWSASPRGRQLNTIERMISDRLNEPVARRPFWDGCMHSKITVGPFGYVFGRTGPRSMGHLQCRRKRRVISAYGFQLRQVWVTCIPA